MIEQVVNAVTTGASYQDTALLISYDEGGGFADHVTPFHAPAGEWFGQGLRLHNQHLMTRRYTWRVGR